MSNVEEAAPVPKTENSELDSFSESSPEPDDPHFIQEVAQVQKRKGGRKPVCTPLAFGYALPNVHDPDICNLGREEATESPGSGRFPGAADGIYQAARDDHQTP